jgi:Domain of unknown function (DUF4956)
MGKNEVMSDVPLRLALDLASIAALIYGIYLPRYRRMDLVVVYGLFNLGLFLAIVVITRGEVTLGIGLGLFAVLSMIRLRSETFSNRELAYFFVALVLALVTAIDVGGLAPAAGLAAIALAAAWVVDHPRFNRPTSRLEVTLELVFSDPEALRRHLEERLNARVTEASVLEIDYVRETTRAVVQYVAGPRTRPVPQEALDVTVAGRAR